MRKLASLASIVLLLLSALVAQVAQAADTVITATVVITNYANITGIGAEKITISNDWGASVRTWTNAVFTPATQILRTNSIATDAQRLLVHLATYPKIGTRVSGNGSSFIQLVASNNLALLVLLSPTTYGYVTYSTQSLSAATVIRVPMSVEGTNATNLATQLSRDLRTYSHTPALTNAATSNAIVKPLVIGSGGVLALEGAGAATVSLTPTSAVVSVTHTNAADSNVIVKPLVLSNKILGLEGAGVATVSMSPTSAVVSVTLTNAADSNVTVKPLVLSNKILGVEGSGQASLSMTPTSTVVNVPLAAKLDNLLSTNAIGRLRSLVPSPNTTNQIDIANGPQVYYWTNLATNMVLQCTNVWTAGVTNRSLDFFFTGHASLPFTVTFVCPNPAGVAFRWGFGSATNGLTSFTVTNGMAVGATLTFWETNLAEAYFSPVR